MPTAPHDARLLYAGSKLLEMDQELSKICDTLNEDYPRTVVKLHMMRLLVHEILQDLRENATEEEDD